MRKNIVLVIGVLIFGTFLCASCANPKWFMCNSNGIFQYNRHTGQLELLWENAAQPTTAVHDTVYVHPDSKTAP